MNLTEFTSCLSHSANEAKNLMSLLIGHYPQEEAAVAILALYESFPDAYKQEKKLFSPIFLKFFNTYGINEVTYPYYAQWSERYSSDTRKAIQDSNPDWAWGADSTISFKNSLELTKALRLVQHVYNHDIQRYQSALPFFKEYEQEINRLIAKDKNKLVNNFSKQEVWNMLIKDDYVFMKTFCDKHDIDFMAILKSIIGADHGYGLSGYLNKNDISLHDLNMMLDDIKAYGEDAFFEQSDFFKKPQQTRSMSLGIAETILYAFCYENIEHGCLIASKFHDKLAQLLPWNGTDPYDDVMWEKYCENKCREVYTSYGMQNHHLKRLSDETISQIGTLLKTVSLKAQLDQKLKHKDKTPKTLTKI